MSDLLCLDDLDALAREVDARTAYIQDMYHRLIERPGSNLDDPDRGLGVTGWLSEEYNEGWAAQVAAECKKDDRTLDASATVERVDGHVSISLQLTTDDEVIALLVAIDAASGAQLTEVDQ